MKRYGLRIKKGNMNAGFVLQMYVACDKSEAFLSPGFPDQEELYWLVHTRELAEHVRVSKYSTFGLTGEPLTHVFEPDSLEVVTFNLTEAPDETD